MTNSNVISSKPLIFSARDNVNSSFYSCIVQDKQTELNNKKPITIFQKKFYQLDEFPLKLENIYFSDSQTTLNLTKDFNNQNNVQLRNDLIRCVESKSSKLQFVGISNLSIQNNNVVNQKSLVNENSKLIQNTFEFGDNLVKLENQFKGLFYKTGYLLPKNFVTRDPVFLSSVPNLLGTKFTSTASNQILKVLDEIDSENLNKSSINWSNLKLTPFLSARKMSGFNNPDMTTKQLIQFNRQNEYFSKFPQLKFFTNPQIVQQIKVYFGSHFSYPSEYLDTKPEPIKLKLKYYPAKFEGLDGTINYSGPTVLSRPNQVEVTFTQTYGVSGIH